MTTPSQIEAIKSQFLQDHHTLPKWKLLKMSSFKTTTTLPKYRLLKISFQDDHILHM